MNRLFVSAFIVVGTLLAGPELASAPQPLPWFGVSFTWSEVGSKIHMLHVRHVARGGPAELAGVRAGDLISTINGNRVDFGDELEFLLFIAARKPSERLHLTLIREGRAFPVIVTLAQLAEDSRPKWERNLEMARRKRASRASPSQ
jgi:C-terminal processing protease CtpA/Prc